MFLKCISEPIQISDNVRVYAMLRSNMGEAM